MISPFLLFVMVGADIIRRTASCGEDMMFEKANPVWRIIAGVKNETRPRAFGKTNGWQLGLW
jgi:hypothetical protein